MGVVDGLEMVEVEMQQSEAAAAFGPQPRLGQRGLERAAVGKAGQRIGHRLRLGRQMGIAEPRVQGREFAHHGALDLGQVKQFDGQVGGGEIGMGQAMVAHCLGYRQPEGEVEEQPLPVGAAHSDAAQRRGGRGTQRQKDALVGKRCQRLRPADAPWLAQFETVEEIRPRQR